MKKLLSKSVKKVKKGGLSRLLNKNATKNSTVIVFIKEWGATTTTGEGVYLLGTQSVYAYCNIFSHCNAMHEYFITVVIVGKLWIYSTETDASRDIDK